MTVLTRPQGEFLEDTKPYSGRVKGAVILARDVAVQIRDKGLKEMEAEIYDADWRISVKARA